MIFRPVRISELERDVQFRKEVFAASKEELLRVGKENFQPKEWIKSHPGSVLGLGLGTFGTGALFWILGNFLGKRGFLWKIIRTGWAIGVAPFVMAKVTKPFLPLILMIAKNWVSGEMGPNESTTK